MIVEHALLNLLKASTCGLAVAAPFVAMLPDDALSVAERYGFGGLFAFAAVLVYNLWKKATEKLEALKDAQIEELKVKNAELIRKLEALELELRNAPKG